MKAVIYADSTFIGALNIRPKNLFEITQISVINPAENKSKNGLYDKIPKKEKITATAKSASK